ncbi:MAG: DUF1345 domain-containing protein [Acidobacteriota bacterium]|nr:DUF1345 domain-containing protein [Acidobacteriota bacterium]
MKPASPSAAKPAFKHHVFREPRWPALIAMLAAAAISLALPRHLLLGPAWLPLTIVSILMVPIAVSHSRGLHHIVRRLILVANVILTVAMIASLGLLIQGIPQHRETPTALLRSAAALWMANILIFALWYWKLDAGGPMRRELPGAMAHGAFFFPQFARDANTQWLPGFIDYLYLSFNTSTAFSPTDTPVVSRWAKLAGMVQSLVSLMVLALLAARAVNIL